MQRWPTTVISAAQITDLNPENVPVLWNPWNGGWRLMDSMDFPDGFHGMADGFHVDSMDWLMDSMEFPDGFHTV